MRLGIKLVFVLDGSASALKKATLKKRFECRVGTSSDFQPSVERISLQETNKKVRYIHLVIWDCSLTRKILH